MIQLLHHNHATLTKGLSIKKIEVISFEKVLDKLGGRMGIALGRFQCGINKMTICLIKKNGCI
jgi:hypothetical protein